MKLKGLHQGYEIPLCKRNDRGGQSCITEREGEKSN